MFRSLSDSRPSRLALSAVPALTLCLAAASQALADPAAPESDATSSETIVILGDDDSPQNPVRLPRSARISSQTFDSEDIVRLQPRDIYDVLNVGTGLFTTTTGKKAPSNLNVRGDGNYAFVIDGAYMPPFLASRVLSSIPVLGIEEVRVVRTSTALTVNPLVGLVSPSGAPNNGFIVVRTRTPARSEAIARAFVGEDGGLGAGGYGGRRLADGEGYVAGLANYGASEGPEGYNLDRQSSTLLAKAGFSGDRFTLDVTLMHDWSEFGFQRSNQKLVDSTYNARWTLSPLESSVAAVNGSVRWDDRNTTLATIAYTRSDSDFVQESFVNTSRTVLKNDNRFLNASLRHNLFLGDTRFQAGLDHIHWHTPSGQFYYEGIEREEEVFGYFLQADQSLLDGRLNLDLGGRIDQVRIITGIDYYNPGRGPTNPTRIRDQDLPEARFVSGGASLRIAGDWLMNARYGWSTQGARSGVTPFPGVVLEGEERKKFEIGLEGAITGWLRPSINYFEVETTNEAAPRDYIIVNGVQIARYDNTDSRRTGAELVLAGQWGEAGSEGGYRASVTTFFDVLEPSGLLARTQPDTVAEVSLNQSLGDWRASLSGKYVAAYESNAFGRCPTPTGNCATGVSAPYQPIGDFATFNLSLSRQFVVDDNALRITASVRNLTDEAFETTLGYPDVGRVAGLEVTAGF